MVKTNYSDLNPVIVQVLNNLQYKYSNETSEIWCSRVCYPFKKLLEYNPKYFSKNGFIQMIERSYKDREFKAGRCSFYIYCTVCDFLVIIHKNTIKCANKHLNECITKFTKKHLAYSNPIQKNVKKRVSSELSDDEIDEIYSNIYFKYKKSSEFYCSRASKEIKKSVVYRLINSAKVIQWAWRTYKSKSEIWAKWVWNIVRNDNTSDEKKYLNIISHAIRISDNWYVNYFGQRF